MKFSQIKTAIDRLDEEDYNRIDEDELWDDLYANLDLFKKEFYETHGRTFQRFTNKTEELFGFPEIIPMFGFFDLLKKTEMPDNNLSWTIISKNFLGVIKKLGFKDYRLIPLRVIDRNFTTRGHLEDISFYIPKENVVDIPHNDDWFYGFQVLSRVNVIAENEEPPEKLGDPIHFDPNLENIVLPHFFRDTKWTYNLFVSEEAKIALEEAGIRGLRFTEPFRLL